MVKWYDVTECEDDKRRFIAKTGINPFDEIASLESTVSRLTQERDALKAELAEKEKRIGEMERELVGLRGLQIVHTYRGDGAEETSTWACTGCIEKDAELSRLRGALKEIIENSHIGIRDVNTFHQAINYLRSINGIASAALLATDALK